MSRWIPCKKRLPLSGQRVLCGRRTRVYFATYRAAQYGPLWWLDMPSTPSIDPTHWQPEPRGPGARRKSERA